MAGNHRDLRLPRGDVRLTRRDLELLSFLAEHRLALDTHVQRLLGTSMDATRARLRTLAGSGFIARRALFDGEPAVSQIRRPGLAATGSSLPPPRLKLGEYQHDVGLAWLWLAARDGTFGPMREVISERTMRSRDGARDGAAAFGVRLGGVGPGGRERLHYPDLLLVTPQGHRIAVELELSTKDARRRENILAAYGADSSIDAVLYLVEKWPLRRALEASARRVGVQDRVHVQYLRWHESRPLRSRAAAPERAHRPPAELAR